MDGGPDHLRHQVTVRFFVVDDGDPASQGRVVGLPQRSRACSACAGPQLYYASVTDKSGGLPSELVGSISDGLRPFYNPG